MLRLFRNRTDSPRSPHGLAQTFQPPELFESLGDFITVVSIYPVIVKDTETSVGGSLELPALRGCVHCCGNGNGQLIIWNPAQKAVAQQSIDAVQDPGLAVKVEVCDVKESVDTGDFGVVPIAVGAVVGCGVGTNRLKCRFENPLRVQPQAT